MCGAEAMKNVAFVTTMWDQVAEDVGNGREEELKSLVKTMNAAGCAIGRFSKLRSSQAYSAWNIITGIIGEGTQLRALREMKAGKETTASAKIRRPTFQNIRAMFSKLFG